ncbi:MAG TPA: hypothetical protein VF121_10330 [Thermoanaerobaculia bacterium]|nr:hypothetical protein [Thermoanaerobaculia bacterium]
MTNAKDHKTEGGDATERLQRVRNAARVFEILRGAHRSERDPDIELATMIDGLQGARDSAIRSALIDLVSDADSD